MTGRATASGTAAIGYLTNVYPAVSHSFIKREILALEAAGLTVKRWSIRRCQADLPDEADRREAERTAVLLASHGAIIAATFRMLLSRPRRFLEVSRESLRGRPAGLRAAITRLAYVAEACLLVRQAASLGVKHIHAHFGTNPAAVARWAYRLGGPSYSFTVHGPDEFDQPLAHDLHGKIADAGFVVAISHYGRSQLMRWCDVMDWAKLQIVRCGLDETFLAGSPPPIADEAPPVLACVARLAPQKGLPVLLQAAACLKDRGLRFRIVIAGEGNLRPGLEQTIARQGLGDHVVLLGAVSSQSVREQILAARGFVLPSFAEGLPVSIMEALALERPVLTTRIAGIPELVDEQCGWVVNAGDVDGLADAMAEALSASPERLRALGRTGRARVVAMHDATVNAAALLGHIRAVGAGC